MNSIKKSIYDFFMYYSNWKYSTTNFKPQEVIEKKDGMNSLY